jgi:hypothetical protein
MELVLERAAPIHVLYHSFATDSYRCVPRSSLLHLLFSEVLASPQSLYRALFASLFARGQPQTLPRAQIR